MVDWLISFNPAASDGGPRVERSSKVPFLQMLAGFLDALQSLFFWGSAGLVAFGWFLYREMGSLLGNGWMLWLCGSLLVYNFDRLRPDPADAINLPQRQRFFALRLLIISLCAAVLVIVPLRERNGGLLVWVGLAVGASLPYSLTMPGMKRRAKDFWILKPLLPALVILVALLFPAWHSGKWQPAYLALAGWAFLALLINLLLFDLRDVQGDRSTGLLTLAARLSAGKYQTLLWALLALQILLDGLTAHPSRLWGMSLWLGILIIQVRQPRPAGFYHWLVDGMLFVPALQMWLWRS